MAYKFENDLTESLRHLKIADHMTYVTFPLVNERRLILKIFEEIYLSIISTINSILNYEALYKRITLYKDNNDNFNTFLKKCTKEYGLKNDHIKKIKEIIDLYKKHKKSAMEFVRKDNIVIMSDNLKTEILNIESTKRYLLTAKELLMKAHTKIKDASQ